MSIESHWERIADFPGRIRVSGEVRVDIRVQIRVLAGHLSELPRKPRSGWVALGSESHRLGSKQAFQKHADPSPTDSDPCLEFSCLWSESDQARSRLMPTARVVTTSSCTQVSCTEGLTLGRGYPCEFLARTAAPGYRSASSSSCDIVIGIASRGASRLCHRALRRVFPRSSGDGYG